MVLSAFIDGLPATLEEAVALLPVNRKKVVDRGDGWFELPAKDGAGLFLVWPSAHGAFCFWIGGRFPELPAGVGVMIDDLATALADVQRQRAFTLTHGAVLVGNAWRSDLTAPEVMELAQYGQQVGGMLAYNGGELEFRLTGDGILYTHTPREAEWFWLEWLEGGAADAAA